MSDPPVILVVDDDDDVRELVAILLEADGFSVVCAADGAEALRRLREGGQPALVLLDLRMPKLSGEELMQRLGKSPPVPVVVMSGDCDARRTAEALGATACLTKPMNVDDLLEVVARSARR